MKEAAVYVRISKDGDGEGLGVKRQEEDCRALASRRGLTVGEVYRDNDISAVKYRPKWERMLRAISEGQIGTVIAYSSSRLYRDVDGDKARLFAACMEQDQNGDRVRIETVASGTIDPYTANGRMLANILASVDAAERERTGERLQRMMKRKQDRGEWVGRVPYGWRVKDKHLVADRSEQATLRKAARVFVRGGTYQEAADILGVSAPSVARRILMTSRVQLTLGDLGDQLAEAVRSRRMERVPASSRSMLGGVARCEICQGPLRRSATRAGRQGRWYTYRCPDTGHVGVSGPWLEEYVSAAVLDAIDPKALSKRMRERQKNPKAAEVAAFEQRIAELEDLLGDGTLPKAAFVRQRDRLQARIAELGQADDDAPELALDVARNLGEFWPKMTIIERRDVIRALVRRIVVTKAPPHSNGRAPTSDRVEIEWR